MEKMLIKNALLIDGKSDEPKENMSILIEGKKIKKVGEDITLFGDVKVIDVQGKTVMPGLIDAHVHICLSGEPDPLALVKEPQGMVIIKAIKHLEEYINAGFTTLRDMGGINYFDIALKFAIEKGLIVGPRLFTSGKVIGETGGHVDFYMPWGFSVNLGLSRIADGVDEVLKATREQIRVGADWVKICTTGGVMSPADDPRYSQLSIEEIRTIVEEAKSKGRRVATHAQGTQGIKNAIIGGVASIEHGIYLDDEAIELMLEKGVYLVPTLVAPYNIIKHGVEAGIPEYAVKKAEQVFEIHKKSFKKAYKAGVKIAMGTDAGTPFNYHGNNALELQLMVENGMKPMEAIMAATSSAAELLGIADKVGTIEEGKIADIIVVDGNPIKDIKILQEKGKIVMVFKEGKLLKGLTKS